MNLGRPRFSYEQATAKAKELDPTAICRRTDSALHYECCRIIVIRDGHRCLVASGPDWFEALGNFWEWCDKHPITEATKLVTL